VTGKTFYGVHRFGAHMVFHSFNIMVNDVRSEAEELEKIGEQLVPMGYVTREFLSCSC